MIKGKARLVSVSLKNKRYEIVKPVYIFCEQSILVKHRITQEQHPPYLPDLALCAFLKCRNRKIITSVISEHAEELISEHTEEH